MSTVCIDTFANPVGATGSWSNPYTTYAAAEAAASDGDEVLIKNPWAQIRENTLAGYLYLSKQLRIRSLDSRRPATLMGESGTFSVRFGDSNISLEDVIVSSGDDGNSTAILGASSSSVLDNLCLKNVEIKLNHDCSSAGRALLFSGSAIHTNIDLDDVVINVGTRDYGGIYAGCDGMRMNRVNCELPTSKNGVALRAIAGARNITAIDSLFSGNIGIQQDSVGASTQMRLARVKVLADLYGMLLSGADATFLMKLMFDDVHVHAYQQGIVGQNRITAEFLRVHSRADNVAIGLPTDNDPVYEDVKSTLRDCSAVAEGNAGHAMLFGQGCTSAYLQNCLALAYHGAFAAVLKGVKGYWDGGAIIGGSSQSALIKGGQNWKLGGGVKVVQNTGGNALEVRNGDTTPLSANCEVKEARFIITDGNLYEFDPDSEDTTTVVDENIVEVLYDGSYGSIKGTVVSSESEIDTAWEAAGGAQANNDDNSIFGGSRLARLADFTNLGTGARAVTINVKDGMAANLENAVVRMAEGVDTFVGVTDASGNVTFSLDDADYTLSIYKTGYSYTPTTQTISASGTINVVLVTSTPSMPSSPDQTTGYFVVVDLSDTPVASPTFEYWMIDAPDGSGAVIETTRTSGTGNVAGLCEIPMFKGGTYKVAVRGAKEFEVTVSASAGDATEISNEVIIVPS